MRGWYLLIPAVAVLGGCRAKPSPALLAAAPIVVADAGLAAPQAVLHDPALDLYYVANANGSPLAADDNGFISKLSPDGQVLDLKWIDGASDSVTLNAPRGMVTGNGYLYVADLGTIRRFDVRTGGPRGDFPIKGATALSGLAVDSQGNLYAADAGLQMGAGGLEPSGTDAVYMLRPSAKVETVARGEFLHHPTGLAVSGDTLWVVGSGSNELHRLDGGKVAEVVHLPSGGLDGLMLFDGVAYVSSSEGKAVYRGPLRGPFQELIAGIAAPAGIGHDLWRHRVLVPLVTENAVRIVPLTP